MDVGSIIGLITAGLVLLGSAVTLGFKLYEAGKVILKDQNWKKICDIAVVAMEAAEKSGKSGCEKKQQVMEAIKAGCAELGIDVAPFLCDVNKYIEDIIAITKKINNK